MTKERESQIGEQIKELAGILCGAVKGSWNDIVFTVAYRIGVTKSRLSDMLFFRNDPEGEYISAYSKDGLTSINLSDLKRITACCYQLSQICETYGSRWCQYTICIDRNGHFVSYFDYPQKVACYDPFDSKNLKKWRQRFLNDEQNNRK